MLQETRKFAVAFLLLLLASGKDLSAQNAAGVSGTVRNLQGKPQMGVLVELLGSSTSLTALTDLQGRYQIRNVLPGVYQLRATATLYLPSLRRQVRLQPSTNPIVNLTMTGFFDETSWMSATRPQTAGERDDWTWTLRSPANRPLLRLAADDADPAPTRGENSGTGNGIHGEVSFESSAGRFGDSGSGESLVASHRSSDQKKRVTVRSRLMQTTGGTAEIPTSMSALLEAEGSTGTKHKAVVRLATFPQVRNAQGIALTELEVGSAERIQLAELASLEAGSESQYLTAGASAVVTHPFLRLTSRPVSGWSVGYAVSTSSNLNRFDDLGVENSSAPLAVTAGNHLLTDTHLHQEAVVRRTLGKARLQLTYDHDDLRRSAVLGRLRTAKPGSAPDETSRLVPQSVVVDTSNGVFRLFGPGWSESGFGMAVDIPVSEALTLSGGYLIGPGVSSTAVSRQSTSGSSFGVSRSSAVLASVKGRIARTGTRVSVTYRWQPETMVSTISPSAMAGVEPYLGLHLRQAVSSNVDVWVDGDNLLAQGYQPVGLAQQQALLASALRDLRAGLSITF